MIHFFVRLTLAYLVERLVIKPKPRYWAGLVSADKIKKGDLLIVRDYRLGTASRPLPFGVALEDAGLFEPVKVRIR